MSQAMNAAKPTPRRNPGYISGLPTEISEEIRSLGLQGVPVSQIVGRINGWLESQGKKPVFKHMVERYVQQAKQTAFAKSCFDEIARQHVGGDDMAQKNQEGLRAILFQDIFSTLNKKELDPDVLQRLIGKHKNLEATANVRKRRQGGKKTLTKAAREKRAEKAACKRLDRLRTLTVRWQIRDGDLTKDEERECDQLLKMELADKEIIREAYKKRDAYLRRLGVKPSDEEHGYRPDLELFEIPRTIMGGILPPDQEKKYHEHHKKENEESKDKPGMRYRILIARFISHGGEPNESDLQELLQLDSDMRQREELRRKRKKQDGGNHRSPTSNPALHARRQESRQKP